MAPWSASHRQQIMAVFHRGDGRTVPDSPLTVPRRRLLVIRGLRMKHP